ncbi:MAG: D-2-hydroxyacid dehydrogenase [Brachybacterium sp.]|nr:D-2-hydroxyacid dehydrogenase [Brachybacterium sp.]
MKILFMGVREDETPAIEAWRAAHPDHEVTTTTDVLTMETVEELADYDALVVQQVIVPDTAIYARLRELGITQISSRTAGVDMFDLEAARAAGIAITNVPVYSPNAIAEFALASAMHLTRSFPAIARKNAERDFRFIGLIGREIATLRVAIIGTGAIGYRTAQHFRALGADVVAFDLFPREDFAAIGTYAATIEDAIDGADIVSLHIPATEENHHLLDADMLARLAPGAIVVNAGRGALVDTRALLDAIDSGHLAGAALDTYENEQEYFRFDWRDKDLGDPVLEELLAHDQVLLTPHVAFYSETAVANLVTGGLDNAVEVATTGTAASVVNAA